MDSSSKVAPGEKIVIIEGMGPEAMVDLRQRIIAKTVALDQSLQALAGDQKVFL